MRQSQVLPPLQACRRATASNSSLGSHAGGDYGQGRALSLAFLCSSQKAAANDDDASREDAIMQARLCGRRVLCCVVLAALLLPFVRIAPVSAQPTPLKIGISETVNTVLAIWMAEAAGLYAANGIA